MSFWDSEIFNEAESKKSFETLPAGKYEGVLVDAETKQTKNGMGFYLDCQIEITGPTHKGSKVFPKINVHNANHKAVAIGMGQLHQLAMAGGAVEWWEQCKKATSLDSALKHLNTLHGAMAQKPFGLTLTVKVDEKYGDSNEVRSYTVLQADTAPTTTTPEDEDVPF